MRLEIVPHTRLLHYEPLHFAAYLGLLDDLYTQKTVQTVQIATCGRFGRLLKGTHSIRGRFRLPFSLQIDQIPLAS